MNPDLKAYYEAQFKMFESAGWRDFVKQYEDMEKATDTISGLTAETLRFRQGELSIIRHVVSWENVVRQAFESLADQGGEV